MSDYSLFVAKIMAQPPATEAAPVFEKVLPYWRWLDDDYIAQGKVSKTAIFEIFLAIGFYYLVARFSPYPLVTVFTFLVVPFLLLRSEASIERGVELLEKSWSKTAHTQRDRWITYGFSTLVGAALTYWLLHLTQNLLMGHSGWSLLLRQAIVGAVMLTALAAAGGGVMAGIRSRGLVEVRSEPWLAVLMFPGFLLGLFIIGLRIRMQATFTPAHLQKGLNAFSDNWREMVLVSDFRHAPALIPRAGKVSPYLNISTIPLIDGSFKDRVVEVGMKALMYVGATLYRWNIKASCWIWWPLALLLAEVKWPRDPALAADKAPDVRRTTTIFWSSDSFTAGLFTCISAVFLYLLYPDISGDWTKKIPELLRNLIGLIPNDIQNIRYWLIALLFVALLTMLFCMLKARAYPETLQNQDVHQNLPQNPDPSIDKNFDKAAKWLVKARLFIFGSFLLLVYALGLRYAIDKWPDHVGGVVFTWLKNML